MIDQAIQLVAVKDLKVGDQVKVDDGSYVTITGLTTAPYMQFTGGSDGYHLEYEYGGQPQAAIADGDDEIERKVSA